MSALKWLEALYNLSPHLQPGNSHAARLSLSCALLLDDVGRWSNGRCGREGCPTAASTSIKTAVTFQEPTTTRATGFLSRCALGGRCSLEEEATAQQLPAGPHHRVIIGLLGPSHVVSAPRNPTRSELCPLGSPSTRLHSGADRHLTRGAGAAAADRHE